MSNKYKALSKAAHEERRRQKMCLDKHAYDTQEEALDPHQKIYKCPYCSKWHRTGQLDQYTKRKREKNQKGKQVQAAQIIYAAFFSFSIQLLIFFSKTSIGRQPSFSTSS
jgi:hypothetical protein